MTAALEEPEAKERVGNFEMRVVARDPRPEATDSRSRRAAALANWLYAEWEREQQRRMAERN